MRTEFHNFQTKPLPAIISLDQHCRTRLEHPPFVDYKELLTSFLSGKSPQTMKAYQRDIEDFHQFTGLPDAIDALNKLIGSDLGRANGLALRYKVDLINRNLTPSTINRRLSALRSVVKLARTLGYIHWELEVQGLKSKAYRDTRGPGQGGFRAVITAARNQQPKKAARDVAILFLCRYMGLRRGEVASLNYEDIDFDRSVLYLIGKGRLEEEPLTIPRRTLEAICKWLAYRGNHEGALFVNLHHDPSVRDRLTGDGIYHLIVNLGKKAGVKLRPHGIRHLAITSALDAGVGIREAQRFSRHADPNVLMRYDDNRMDLAGKVAQQLEDLDSAV